MAAHGGNRITPLDRPVVQTEDKVELKAKEELKVWTKLETEPAEQNVKLGNRSSNVHMVEFNTQNEHKDTGPTIMHNDDSERQHISTCAQDKLHILASTAMVCVSLVHTPQHYSRL